MANFFDQFDAAQKPQNFFDQFDESKEEQVKAPVEEQGFIDRLGRATGRGFSQLGESAEGISLGVKSALGAKEAAGAQAERMRKESEAQAGEPAPITFEELEKTYGKEGAIAALKKLPAYVAEQVLQSAPSMAVPLAVGAGVGAVSGPFAPITGPLAGMGTYAVQQFGQFMQRQAQEGATGETLEPGKAALAAGVSAPIGYFADRFTLGLGKVPQKILGKELAEELALRTGKTAAGRAATGATLGVIAEAPTEVLEQAAERWQAGLSLTDEDATREYKEAFFGAAAVGGLGGAAARVMPSAKTAQPKATDEFAKEEEEFRKKFGTTEAVAPEKETVVPKEAAPVVVEPPTEFPGGYVATPREISSQEVPEAFGIFPEGSDKPLTTVASQEEAEKKLQTLTEIRQEEQQSLVEESDKISSDIKAEQRKLEVMEAKGQTDTDEYVQGKAKLSTMEDEAAQKIKDINDQVVNYSAPLTIAPIGTRTEVQREYIVNKGEEQVGVFKSLEEAASTLKERDPEAFKQAEQAEIEKQKVARTQELEAALKPMLAKFGLGDVGLNVVEKLKNNAGGVYLDRLIKVALDEAKPVQTMRHESMHALKDLEFFTPQQWRALEEQANKKWIKEYLENQTAELEVDGKMQTMSRLDAYKQIGLTQSEIVEEAIADAFGAYDRGATPPPGMIAALFKKLKNFFTNFGQALRGAGFESSEDIFQRVERGELKSRKPAEKPEAAPKKAAEEKVEKPAQTMREHLSLLRKAHPDEIDISTQNPQGVKRIYDPITEMLSIDEAAVREAMKANPKLAEKTIQAIKSYGFIPKDTPDNKVLEVFRSNIVNNLLFLYKKVPADIRNRSKLWYDGANKIANEMAKNYGMSLRQVSAIAAAMSPQKDWFQNVSMAERAIDILKTQGNQAWTPDMLKYAESYVKETKDRKESEKRLDAFEKIKKVASAGTVLNDMDEKSAAAFIRAYDEAFHSRNYRIVTPEGGFGDLVKNNDGTPSTMMWSTYGPIEKAVSIYRDGSRANVSQQLGFEHKIRSFYNNIANPNSEIDHVTIDTHAVAAALFEALAGTDTEVKQNFGGTGSSDVLGVGGTYGLIADAYRDAAKKAGVSAREMQSITWEAVRALFSEEVKATIKPKIRAEWAKYKDGQQSFDETRQNVLKIAGQSEKLDEPDWVDSGVGQFVSDGGTSYDKTFVPTGGVRLRESREIRENVTFNLSAVTNSIPGLKELYSNAMKGDDKAYELLQKVAESSLQYLLKGTGAKIKVEYAKGVYLSDREPSISVSASFDERNQQVVMGSLVKFAENYNQQQIHVRVPTIRKIGHDFGDGSYATPVYEIPLRKKLNNAQISDIINQTGLKGFSVSERQTVVEGKPATENILTAYWVAPNDIEQEFASFDNFQQAVLAAHGLAGIEGSKPKQTVERLYVYGSGDEARIAYKDVQGDFLPREGADTVTPRLISEYLRGEPVRVFKQKDLTNKQVEGQKLLAKVFDELPTKDLKNPLVRSAYNALNKELLRQYNTMPIKVQLVEAKRDEDGNFIDIYKNSAEMRKDVGENNRFKVYKTEPGTFGPEGFNFKDHPLLKDSGVKDTDGKPMLFNDVLRAVHDYYAHNLAEVEFGPKGEAAAWRNHMSVTANPLARWALTAETRAQNAWQNFREGAENIPLKDRPYADQKAMLPPIGFAFTGEADVDQVMADYAATLTPEQQLGSLSPSSQYAAQVKRQVPKFSLRTYYPSAREAEDAAYDKAPPSTKEFKLFFGGSQIMDEGRAVPMFHGSQDIFTQFRENKPIFVSPSAEEAERYGSRRAEKGEDVNVYPLWVRAETPFDYANPEHVQQVMDKMAQNNTLKGKQPAFFNRGHWENIEDKDVQDAIKALGFDSFYVKESGERNLAVFSATQVKSITGNIGDFSRESKDMRFSLRSFNKEDLPQKGRDYTLPQDTLLYHGAYKERADRIEEMGSVLLSRPPMRVSGGTIDEGGLIFFGDEDTAQKFAENRADPMAVEGARQAGVERLTGKVFETATDRPYKLINRNYKMNAQEAKALTEALGLPDYKSLDAGDSLKIATGRALDYSRSTIDRYEVTRRTGQGKETIGAPWPVIFRTLGVDGFYDSLGVALTANNGIKLIGKDGKLEKFSLPNIPQAADNRINETTTTREEKGFVERMVEAIAPRSASHFRQQYLNRYNQLSVYDKKLAEKMGGSGLLADQSAESAALMSDVGSGIAASAMGLGDRHGGIPILRNGITTIDRKTKGLIASLAPLANYGDPKVYQRYQYWAMVKRGQRLNKEGKLTGIDSADVAFAKMIEQKHPEFVSVQKDLIAFNNGLVKYMVDTGVLSKERGEIYTKHADYIPFYRQMDGDTTLGPNLFQALSGVKPPKKLKGAIAEEAPLADFLETMVRNTQSAIQAGVKNYAAQRSIDVASQVKAPGMGVERLKTKQSGPDIINVLEKGNLVSYRTPDKLLVDAVGSLNLNDLPFMGIISAPANLLRNMVTKDPGFMMANLVRDSLSAWVTSGTKMTPIAGTVINFGKALTGKSPGFEALQDAGIIGGYEFSANIEQSGKKLQEDLDKKAGKKDPILLRPFTSVWDALEKGTTASDVATRSLIYERVLKETGSEAEALYRSLEVMNFHRKGSSPIIRVLTAAVPFFNARLQGLDLFYRASTGNMNTNDAKAIQRQFLTRAATMMALSAAYWFMVSDDDEYKKQEQETKDNNWIIPKLGIRIPTPFEVGFLFKTVPERIAAYMFGNDTGKDLKESLYRGAVSTFAFNPVPQVVKPLFEATYNFNTFTWRPIVGQGLQDVAPEFQVGPNTSILAKQLAQALGLSPIKVDHIIKGYTGTMGMYLVDTVDTVLDQFGNSPKASKRFEQLPVIKRFALDPEARGNVTQYFELKDAVDTTVRTLNLLEKTGESDQYMQYLKKNIGTFAFKDYVRDTEKVMKELRDARVAVNSSKEMSGDKKRAALLEINRAENSITSGIQKIKGSIASMQ